jgi:hypothetical protein
MFHFIILTVVAIIRQEDFIHVHSNPGIDIYTQKYAFKCPPDSKIRGIGKYSNLNKENQAVK